MHVCLLHYLSEILQAHAVQHRRAPQWVSSAGCRSCCAQALETNRPFPFVLHHRANEMNGARLFSVEPLQGRALALQRCCYSSPQSLPSAARLARTRRWRKRTGSQEPTHRVIQCNHIYALYVLLRSLPRNTARLHSHMLTPPSPSPPL